MATTAFFTTGHHTAMGSTSATVIVIILMNIVSAYDAIIRLCPYGPWRYARLRPYFTYEKQHKQGGF